MTEEGKPSSRGRDRTDESLRTERERVDRAVADRRTAQQHEADAIVERARDNADAVLESAREDADERLPPTSQVATTLAAARAKEDDVLREERVVADAALHRERAESRRALDRLFPLEREKTDLHLLTERARADDAVAQRDDFLGIVSHDLRNLLGAIVLSAEILSSPADAERVAAQSAAGGKRILRYAARMNRLIGDLLDVASIDAGSLSMHLERGDMREVVAEAADSFRASAEAKGLALEVVLPAEPLDADADRGRILQVLANLITNAIKFTEAGTVTISRVRTADQIKFWVRDTGIGIPQSMRESVFDRFWQVGNDRRGVGLGLYISRSIVNAHRGSIEVETGLGKGSTFSFTLPAGSTDSA